MTRASDPALIWINADGPGVRADGIGGTGMRPVRSRRSQSRGRATVLVKDMMKQEIWMVRPDASLVIAARAMRDQEVGCLPVVEGDRLLGMITDRDLVVRGVAAGLDPALATVRMAMSGNAVTATPEDPLERVRELMAAAPDHPSARARSPRAGGRPDLAPSPHRPVCEMQAARGHLLQAARQQRGPSP